MKYKLVILISFLLPKFSFGCDCKIQESTVAEHYKAYDLVVKGKIVKIQAHKRFNVLTIDVEEDFKGVNKNKTIKVSTPNVGPSCGLGVLVGETWLLYAYKSEKKLFTNSCTQCKNLSMFSGNNQENVKSELDYLRSVKIY